MQPAMCLAAGVASHPSLITLLVVARIRVLRKLLVDALFAEAEYFFGKGELGLNATDSLWIEVSHLCINSKTLRKHNVPNVTGGTLWFWHLSTLLAFMSM
jgi:hypothetical protein